MKKKILYFIVLLLIAPSLIGRGGVGLLYAQIRINNGNDSPLRKLQIAELAITNLYVDSVDEKKLVEDGIRGMIEKLDPHSSYSTPKEVKEMNEPLRGNFEGIGVQFMVCPERELGSLPPQGALHPTEQPFILAAWCLQGFTQMGHVPAPATPCQIRDDVFPHCHPLLLNDV